MANMMRFAGKDKEGIARGIRTDDKGHLITNTNQQTIIAHKKDEKITLAPDGYTHFNIQGDFVSLGVAVFTSQKTKIGVGLTGFNIGENQHHGNIPYQIIDTDSIGGGYGIYTELPLIRIENTNRLYIRNYGTTTVDILVTVVGKYTPPTYGVKSNVVIEKGKVETIDDNIDKKIFSPVNATYQPTTTSLVDIRFPHSSIGIFEQSIMIKNDTDVDIDIDITPIFGTAPDTAYAPTVYSGTVIAGGGRTLFASEVSPVVENTEQRKIIGLPEMRLPANHLRLSYRPRSVRSTGDIKFYVVRRY